MGLELVVYIFEEEFDDFYVLFYVLCLKMGDFWISSFILDLYKEKEYGYYYWFLFFGMYFGWFNKESYVYIFVLLDWKFEFLFIVMYGNVENSIGVLLFGQFFFYIKDEVLEIELFIVMFIIWVL